ncbi:MAG: hypothetical protein EOP91_07010 [Lysobacteraceae bacterium]|nr:MAG: hypothetical protein EOP91_07010 [Xanthomonadaceae bacterium]
MMEPTAEPTINPDTSVYRILYFEEVYPSRAAEEQAEKSKLAAFGTLARLNPLNRPKADTVRLSKWELRYEPFWHLVARREVDYLHEAVYPVQITNPHARRIGIAGTSFEILPGSGGKPRIDVQLQEFCHRKIDVVIHQDALKRGIKPAKLQGYIDRYKAVERNQLDVDGTVPPQLPFNTAVQIARAKLAAEPIDAHSIQGDVIEFAIAHLYFRPVFAFEYNWNNKLGVIEIDGLTGEVIENGEWFREKVDIVMSREMMFELGAEVASAVVPGSGYAVKLLNKVTQEKPAAG